MSELKLQGGSSGSSTYIIQGGAGDTNRTFTLPNVADATLISSSDSQTISTAMLADSAIITAKVADANITPSKLNGAQTGTAPAFVVRAWLYYNGVTNAIVGSGNVSSVTDNGNGNYTVNFTTALPNATYSAPATGYRQTSFTNSGTQTSNFTTSSYIIFHVENGTNVDTSVIATVVVG